MITEQELEQVIGDIIIGWQNEKVGSQSIIDFKDYKQFDKQIKERLEQKGVKAKLEYNFMGLTVDYIRE